MSRAFTSIDYDNKISRQIKKALTMGGQLSEEIQDEIIKILESESISIDSFNEYMSKYHNKQNVLTNYSNSSISPATSESHHDSFSLVEPLKQNESMQQLNQSSSSHSSTGPALEMKTNDTSDLTLLTLKLLEELKQTNANLQHIKQYLSQAPLSSSSGQSMNMP
jgi:hypothetical protein